MTVSSSTNRVSYAGNGSTTVFPYTYKIFDEDDLTVILRAADGTETVKTITSDYTVSGVGNAGGGNVTMLTAPATGETLVILREQDLVQELDIVPNDPFPAESLEAALDKLTFMVQQHQETLDRSLKVSRTTTIATSEFTETPAQRAGKFLGFDGSGDLFVASTTAGSITVSAYIEDFLLTTDSVSAFAYLGVTATASELNTASTHYVPSGGIIMWSGSVGSIPSGWLLCDGTSGTPDLRDRFIVGAGNSYAVGATGGATTSTKTTSTSGSHDHGGTNSSSVTISRDGWGTEGSALGSVTAGRLIVGSGQSEIGETLESLRGAGSDRTDGSHSHTINSDGSHNHSVTVDTVPPYYSLAYIMKA